MKFYNSCFEAMQSLGLKMPAALREVEALYPVYLNSYYLNLIEPENWQRDPIALQALPRVEELSDVTSSMDPLAEEAQMPTPKLIHRFRDRVVLLVTGKCAMRCRFCFRKREWTGGENLSDLSDAELAWAVKYLSEHPEIREVLVSGGDALMLPPERLKQILLTLKNIPSIDIIRVASRIPVVWPQRLTDEMAEMLGSIPGLWFATHFNHPRELTDEALAACKKLVRAGVPVFNQTVLLKGVNDDAEVLETLFRTLVANRVKPHYLFHVDPVRGVRHFATGIECGLKILRTFRSRLSSLAVPTFAIDLPEGGGKVALQPEYRQNGLFPDIKNQRWIDYDTDFKA